MKKVQLSSITIGGSDMLTNEEKRNTLGGNMLPTDSCSSRNGVICECANGSIYCVTSRVGCERSQSYCGF